ncbi:uncharacterized protein LOC111709745 isoform X2 [Eurytemora carolleeae]|uniref:uncharacterized protein LOC111709745 isoform X2 n=1 Tax=Eurytemora carolleeae TaxID=1294199 RepID=UPI000C78779A|nr:uncharacterized protein LOC111709745 isoform X2 [Eurytemora carolleeae]|eukprot:XP_023339410.1 uncharacterized protein LOC111709745 isoform X2 [Eurytemora affinis]
MVLLLVLVGEGSMCQSPICANRQEFKQFTKQNIKTEILRKLGLNSAPNVTLSQIPGSHHIKNMIRKMETESEEGMLSDQGANFDDDHFQAKEITILPSKCKYLSPPALLLALYYPTSNSLFVERK